MSKKSRKRNKKILAALALAGGAALMAKRGKGVAQGVSGSDKAKFTSDAAYSPAPKAVTGTEYPGANKAVAPISKNKFRTRHRITDSAGNTIDGVNKVANIAAMNAPKGIYPPGSVPMPLKAGNLRGFKRPCKKGGRVTGIAKRGFGRALMKGKK